MKPTQDQWNTFHTKLSDGTGITGDMVCSIRVMSIGEGKNRKEVALRLVEKLNQPHRDHGKSKSGRRRHRREHYQTMLNFVASATEEQWNSILLPYLSAE